MGYLPIETARVAQDLATWQDATLDVLSPLGFDVALFDTKPPRRSLRTRGFDGSVLATTRKRWAVYVHELAAVSGLAARNGVALDSEVLGARRERLSYFQDSARPHGGRCSLVAHLSAGGRDLGGLVLGRCGSEFRATDCATVQALLAPLSVGLAAVLASDRVRLPVSVTGREREVLGFVQLGYTNADIAQAIGTSVNTVRNHVAALLAKVGAANRAELVGLTL